MHLRAEQGQSQFFAQAKGNVVGRTEKVCACIQAKPVHPVGAQAPAHPAVSLKQNGIDAVLLERVGGTQACGASTNYDHSACLRDHRVFLTLLGNDPRDQASQPALTVPCPVRVSALLLQDSVHAASELSLVGDIHLRAVIYQNVHARNTTAGMAQRTRPESCGLPGPVPGMRILPGSCIIDPLNRAAGTAGTLPRSGFIRSGQGGKRDRR